MGINLGISYPHENENELKMLNQMKVFLKSKIQDGWEIDIFVVCPRDLPTAREIAKELGSDTVTLHIFFEQVNFYLESVRSMSLFIGMKLHSVILAMCAGVPSIMLGYSPKCLDFMKSVDMEEYNINLKYFNIYDLNKSFDQIIAHQDMLNNKIYNNMNIFRDKQITKASEIVQLFSSKNNKLVI